MNDIRPTLYLSRLLPEPVMAIVRERFRLVQEPLICCPVHQRFVKDSADPYGDRHPGRSHHAETIDTATRLKIIANYAVGYNNIDLMAARQRGLIVTNTPEVSDGCHRRPHLGPALGDGTPHCRRGYPCSIRPFDRVEYTTFRERRSRTRPWELSAWGGSGKVVVGAKGFACRYATTPANRCSLIPPPRVEYRTLQELLSEADVVTIHVPLTPTTHHLIGAPELAWMRPTAFLINTARGPIIDEGAWSTPSKKESLPGRGSMSMSRNRDMHRLGAVEARSFAPPFRLCHTSTRGCRWDWSA